MPRRADVPNDNTSGIVGHLNKAFGRASNTVAGAIKESFTGTGHEQQGIRAMADAAKTLGSLAKAGVTGGDKAEAKEKMKKAAESGFDYLSEGRTKYARLADAAEKRVWGK